MIDQLPLHPSYFFVGLDAIDWLLECAMPNYAGEASCSPIRKPVRKAATDRADALRYAYQWLKAYRCCSKSVPPRARERARASGYELHIHALNVETYFLPVLQSFRFNLERNARYHIFNRSAFQDFGSTKFPRHDFHDLGMKRLVYLKSVKHCVRVPYRYVKSDIITTIIPTTLFAAAAAPPCNIRNLLDVIFWIWLHLLQFNVANQLVNPEEDSKNKSYRPIPSGLISMRDATIFRWLLTPACLWLSAAHSTYLFAISAVLASLFIWYNELHGHEFWLSKNVLTATGLSLFELGGTLVAGCNKSAIEPIALVAVAMSMVMFATTLHCQDFKDAEGDRMIGRKTLPILFPSLARISVMIGLPLWSVCLTCLWKIDVICSAIFVAYAGLVGMRFMLLQDTQADRKSCQLYCLWFSFAHLLPGYWRLVHGSGTCLASF